MEESTLFRIKQCVNNVSKVYLFCVYLPFAGSSVAATDDDLAVFVWDNAIDCCSSDLLCKPNFFNGQNFWLADEEDRSFNFAVVVVVVAVAVDDIRFIII